MNTEDLRDTSLGAALDRAVYDLTPRADIAEVKRRGATRRVTQRLVVIGSVALFAALVAFAAANVGRDVIRRGQPLSTYSSKEAPWTFTYPDGWFVTTEVSAGPSQTADVTQTFVSNVELPPGWTSGPNGPTPLPRTVPGDGVIVLIDHLWSPGAGIGSAPTTGTGAFHPDAQNPGWSYNETPGCVGTLCFHVIRWFGPQASIADRQTAAQIAGSITPAHPTSRWSETDGVQTVLHDETNRFVVTVPSDGWKVAEKNLTPWLSEPTEIFSAGTFAMPVSANPDDGLRVFDAPVAPAALATMTSTDAFVSVQESAPVGAPHDDRPTSFRTASARPCCSASTGDYPFTWWWIPFIDQGRAFYLFVAIGNEASTTTVDQAWSVADSLSFEPSSTASASSRASVSAVG